MRNIAFYANWAQFWGGPTGGGKYNSPLTYLPFLKGLDRIIYGFLMFGVKPNPDLNDNPTPNPYGGLDTGCSYHGSSNQQPYIDSGDFGTYMMYPNECFTGSSVPIWQQILGPFAWLAGLNNLLQSNQRLDDPTCFEMFQMIKDIAPQMKIVASYGGWTWTHGGAAFSDLSPTKFHDMTSTQENRSAFIQSSYAFLKNNGFDGVDFDWEYPGQTLGILTDDEANSDFYNFEQLLTEYRSYVQSQGDPNFLISIQASGFLSSDIVSRQISNLPGYTQMSMQDDSDYFTWLKGLLTNAGLDEINLMTYDYYVAEKGGKTLPNAPLTCGTNSDISNCLSKTITLLKQVMNSDDLMNKFNLGLACYGRSFSGVNQLQSLKNSKDLIENSVLLNTTGPVASMGYGGETGVVSYATIMQKLKPINIEKKK